MLRKMVKTVIAMMVFMTIPVLSGCNEASKPTHFQIVTPVETVVAPAATPEPTKVITPTVIAASFVPDGKDGCVTMRQSIGKLAEGEPFDSHVCIGIGEKVVDVILDNPGSFAERNLWVEATGNYLQKVGKTACPNPDGSGASYLAIIVKGPLFEQFQSTGNATKAVQTNSASVKAPSFCTGK